MRILYDHQAFSLQNLGGITGYYWQLASHLSRRAGVCVDVSLGFNRCHYPFPSQEQPGLRVFGWSTSMPAGLKRYALNEAVTGAWNVVNGKWDIYHSTLYRGMPTVRSQRVVATNHDCTQNRFPELFPNPQRVIHAKRKLYARADAIICVSEFSRRDLLKYYDVDPAKVHTIYLGLPRLVRSLDIAHEFISRLRRPYLLYVGARYSYKNFKGLLEAYCAGGFTRDYDLVVVGGGAFTQEERSEIRRLDIAERILQWEFVSDAILAEAYIRAELFVSPSLYEGFGLPPLEAMSFSCPVLASSTASIPEICGDAALYFNPEISGDLERGLRDALNAADRGGHIARGLERVQRYNWKTNADETLRVYEDLLR
jgi:glycosyltransferase involved in cell wall biosynthesis